MNLPAITRRVLLRHGVADEKLDDVVQAVSSALQSVPLVGDWAKAISAMHEAGMPPAAVSSTARTLAELMDGGQQPHVILRDEAPENVRTILCSCGAEFQLSPLASGGLVPEDEGYRASIFGPFGGDACHLIFGIFMKQVMSVHMGAQAQNPAEEA